jgi:hypothetical protein
MYDVRMDELILTLDSTGSRRFRCFTDFKAGQINARNCDLALNGTVIETKTAQGDGMPNVWSLILKL